jgi:hypothetical protein
MIETKSPPADLPVFNRHFWDGTFHHTRIGTGSLGGKANGLAFIKDFLAQGIGPNTFRDVEINVPTMAVIATDFFEEFVVENRLDKLKFGEMSDEHIAHAFQRADLPVELLGDLRALINQVKTPLAIRSSTLLEDAAEHPFAGVYSTKMIPNNQFDPDARFRRLTEAIKFVYASTYFREARDYLLTTGRKAGEEKMAVIIQEVVGHRHGDRYYPEFSGVARSYNFYATAPAHPEDGVVNLALGLGKTVVDEGIGWSFSPHYPKRKPPFGSVQEMLSGSQTEFWAINMGKAPAYDPVNEVEYLVRANLADAESDEVLQYLASTYDPERDRLIPGVGARGPRVLDFAPLLLLEQFPVSRLISELLEVAENAVGAKVEIEFAATIEKERGERNRVRFGFLQVRPITVTEQLVEVSVEDLSDPHVVVASDTVMGNGIDDNIDDVVFVRPEHFDPVHTPIIAKHLEGINRELNAQGRPYLLIGFGRWGSTHASLGIPVDWSQISGACTIVEATLPQMNVEMSQGSHFFHNLTSFQATYFTVPFERRAGIDWDWLNQQPVIQETEFVRHVRPNQPLSVRVDGRSGRGVILCQARPEASGGAR